MKPSSAKAKGKLLEDYVADQIRDKGIDPKAIRDGGSGAGNREKGDIVTSMMILDQNAGIECKNQKIIKIPDWWRQTKKLELLGREPVLAFKIFGEPLEETKVVIYLDTFLELVKRQNETVEIEVPKEDSRQLKWEIENLVRSAKAVIKRLEKE